MSDILVLNTQLMCSPPSVSSVTLAQDAFDLRKHKARAPGGPVRRTFSFENKSPGAVGRMTLKITVHGKHKDSRGVGGGGVYQ